MVKHRELSKSEYEGLSDNLKKIDSEMFELSAKYQELKSKYDEVNKEIVYYKMFHDPDVIISEVNNKNLGHKWVGRVLIPSKFMSRMDLTNKRHYMSFNICDGSLFKDKKDPELIKLAKEKAIETIMRKKDIYFEHSLNKKKIIKLTESELVSLIKKLIL
jgi:hypothetical protein